MEKTNEKMFLILEDKISQLENKLSKLLILEDKISQLENKLSKMVNNTTDNIENPPMNRPSKPLTNAEIIGNPINLGKIEVAEHDFPDIMNWFDARSACNNLGEEWRLPNLNEMEYVYQYKQRVGGFINGIYWTGSEAQGDYAFGINFEYGSVGDSRDRKYLYNVRAVRWNRS